ncbi:hypothetical protein HZB60_12245 [candidate division KSB1 bacterium]|nr:hypothetical protein [candidate division KSB1 bacterium]
MKKAILIAALALASLLLIAGCGLVSGTVFVSQDVGGQIRTSTEAGPNLRGRGALDDQFTGVVVDLTDNSNWGDITVEGVEDVCIRLTATNNLTQNVSGEIWITLDTNRANIHSIAGVQAAGGFRLFQGLALSASQTRTFTCAETLTLFENLEQFSDAVAVGTFAAWGRGDQDQYDITISDIYIGVHITGSL